MNRLLSSTIVSLCVAALTLPVAAQSSASALDGVYQAVGDNIVIAGGLRNSGDLSSLPLTSAARDRMKDVVLADDPARLCQPIGPFRMMAAPGTKIEFVASRGLMMLLFEDINHGYLRPIYLDRGHPPNPNPTRNGDAVGRWENGTFVVDTVAFDERAWLNDQGARHSGALHMVERIRPILNGQVLEYRVTADDPSALARPFSYTRYYRRLDSEIEEQVCLFN